MWWLSQSPPTCHLLQTPAHSGTHPNRTYRLLCCSIPLLEPPMDRALIELYAAGASEPQRAIRGLSRAQLNSFPIPGTWSIQQIVMHLMDSDLIASYRMKRLI